MNQVTVRYESEVLTAGEPLAPASHLYLDLLSRRVYAAPGPRRAAFGGQPDRQVAAGEKFRAITTLIVRLGPGTEGRMADLPEVIPPR